MVVQATLLEMFIKLLKCGMWYLVTKLSYNGCF